MDAAQFVTQQDLETALEKLYRRTEGMVGEIIGEALQLIAKRFDQLEQRLDRVEERLDRIEDKLDRTAAIVDLHAVDIRALQRKST
jgi:tetrahydromethanopterin S-methyltransferase subunit G